MSLDFIPAMNQDQIYETQAVETFKSLVDKRKYSEAIRFLSELDSTLKEYRER
jgi:hypothetical protein